MELAQPVRLMLVEDETPIAEALIYALSTDGFQVARAATLSAARGLIAKENFSLIILDVGLPDGVGFDFCLELRKQGVEIPVLFLTARASEVDRVVGLEIGGDDYVTKPFSPREICARVRSILRRVNKTCSSGSSTEKDLEVLVQKGSFVIDDPRKKISLKGKALELSRYEYGVLLLLLNANGRVLSRESIMENVWSEPEMSLDRTVDAHIKMLRQKIKQIDGSHEYIMTHRGLGYSMSEE